MEGGGKLIGEGESEVPAYSKILLKANMNVDVAEMAGLTVYHVSVSWFKVKTDIAFAVIPFTYHTIEIISSQISDQIEFILEWDMYL